jgi:hypothetical protein
LVTALSSVPDAMQLKCCVLPRTFDAVTVHVSPDDQVAVNTPAGAPPVWLLMKCHAPVSLPHD